MADRADVMLVAPDPRFLSVIIDHLKSNAAREPEVRPRLGTWFDGPGMRHFMGTVAMSSTADGRAQKLEALARRTGCERIIFVGRAGGMPMSDVLAAGSGRLQQDRYCCTEPSSVEELLEDVGMDVVLHGPARMHLHNALRVGRPDLPELGRVEDNDDGGGGVYRLNDPEAQRAMERVQAILERNGGVIPQPPPARPADGHIRARVPAGIIFFGANDVPDLDAYEGLPDDAVPWEVAERRAANAAGRAENDDEEEEEDDDEDQGQGGPVRPRASVLQRNRRGAMRGWLARRLNQRREEVEARRAVRLADVDDGARRAMQARDEPEGIEAMATTSEENTCMICCTAHVTAMLLPCLHYMFCRSCIDTWLNNSADGRRKCPFCNTPDVRVVQPRHQTDYAAEHKRRRTDPGHRADVAKHLREAADALCPPEPDRQLGVDPRE